MMIHEITNLAGPHKKRKRVGRGRSSGKGKTSGRGHKGASAVSGFSSRHQSEGGQTPLFRRIRKYGFSNVRYTTNFWIINLVDLLQHENFAKGGSVDKASLVKAGLIRDESRALKVLGDLGDKGLGVKFDVVAERVSDSARKHITDAGGTIKELGTRRDRVRGVDRESDDRSPRNLTKKLRRSKGGSGSYAKTGKKK